MKKKLALSIVKSAFVASSFLQHLDTYLKTSKDFLFIPTKNGEQIRIREMNIGFDEENPVIVEGHPVIEDENDLDMLNIEVFEGRLRCYGYNQINIVVLAFDWDYANNLTRSFKMMLDKLVMNNTSKGKTWNYYLKEEAISNKEVIELSQENNKIFTLMPGSILS